MRTPLMTGSARQMYVEGLVYGNVTADEARSFSTELEAILRSRSAVRHISHAFDARVQCTRSRG